MISVVTIHGSGGKVMAPFGQSENFIRGKPKMVKIIAVDPDENTPLVVRKELVGMTIRTMFSRDDLGKNFENVVPEGARLAYAADVIEALTKAGKIEAARLLQATAPDQLDMYVFEPGIFEIILQLV